MTFVDALGNRDSLILGYDPNASDTIDPSFGAINIFSSSPHNVNTSTKFNMHGSDF